MSMLSSMTDRLRKTAYTVERVKNDAVGKLSLSGSIALAMAAMDMRDAADTIAQLRNTCHDLQRENEELKAENAKLREVAGQMAHDYAEQTREIRALKALARDMYACINHVTGTDAHWDCTACPLDGTRECDFEGRMITLDVEVDDAPDEPMSDAARRVFDRLMSELDGGGR